MLPFSHSFILPFYYAGVNATSVYHCGDLARVQFILQELSREFSIRMEHVIHVSAVRFIHGARGFLR